MERLRDIGTGHGEFVPSDARNIKIKPQRQRKAEHTSSCVASFPPSTNRISVCNLYHQIRPVEVVQRATKPMLSLGPTLAKHPRQFAIDDRLVRMSKHRIGCHIFAACKEDQNEVDDLDSWNGQRQARQLQLSKAKRT